MTRTVKSYSLSTEALLRLEEMALLEGRSASRIVERLILGASIAEMTAEKIVAPLPSENPLLRDEEIEEGREAIKSALVAHAEKEPAGTAREALVGGEMLEDVRKRIKKRAEKTPAPTEPGETARHVIKEAVVRKINPMTGKPFGPVPKGG